MKKFKALILTILLILPIMLSGCKSYTLYFKTGVEGLNVASMSITGDDEIVLPTQPVREGFTFDGWYLDDETKEIELTFDYFVQNCTYKDVEVYAKWIENHSITFMNGSELVSQMNIGKVLVSPIKLIQGKAFAGWFTTENFAGNPVEFPLLVTEDMTLYAKYIDEAQSCKISFQDKDGKILHHSIVVTKGETMKYFDSLNIVGYEIEYWKDKTTDVIFDINTPIEQDCTLIPYYKAKEYTVTLNYGTGVDESSIKYYSSLITYGTKIGSLPKPQKTNHSFVGWYLDANFTIPFVEGEIFEIPNDVTIYAKFN